MIEERVLKEREELFQAIAMLKTPEECAAFMKDLCTYQELKAMAQRLKVAKLLMQGVVFHEISEQTGASSATISRVNRTLKDGCDGYKAILERDSGEMEENDE